MLYVENGHKGNLLQPGSLCVYVLFTTQRWEQAACALWNFHDDMCNHFPWERSDCTNQAYAA